MRAVDTRRQLQRLAVPLEIRAAGNALELGNADDDEGLPGDAVQGVGIALKLTDGPVAVERNREVVPRALFAQMHLEPVGEEAQQLPAHRIGIAPDLARVLRAFDPIFEKLGREALTPQEAAELQAQLEFEFTVVLTKLARDTSQQTGPDKQELEL